MSSSKMQKINATQEDEKLNLKKINKKKIKKK